MITKLGWLMYGFCFINSHSQLTLTTLKNNKQVNIVSELKLKMRGPFKSFLQYHNSNCKAIPEMVILAYCLFEEKRQN
jgi:hypothetical protein